MSSSTNTQSGSPDESIKIGYIRRAHGIKGAVIIRPLTDDVGRFSVGDVLTNDSTRGDLTVQSSQKHKEGLLVYLLGVEDRTTAESLRGTSFFVDVSQRRDLDEDEFWPDDLIGLRVVDSWLGEVGVVADVVSTAAQDRIRVDGASGSFDIPLVEAIVTAVDIEAGIVSVAMPDGMLP